jgi:hydroxymethylpyrimidine/phosphomethylpyrimidine kinase
MKGVTNDIKPPVCLTIAGLDPSGGAGIIADIRTFTALGCFATAAVSSVTFQNTQGVFGAVHQTADSVRQQVEPIVDDYDVAAIKTGMLPTGEIISEVARIIEENGLKNVVVDPVVRSTSGFDLIDDVALTVLIDKLFPLADLVTPNIPEAERITGMKIASEGDIKRAAEIMRSKGARNVLIKGGHSYEKGKRGEEDKGRPGVVRTASDYLFLGAAVYVFNAEFIDTTATHGTGCVLSAAIAANLAIGNDLPESVRIAKDFVTEAIHTAPLMGKGHSPINI